MTVRHLAIGIGLILQGDTYLLQLRGDNPAIGAAGLIGAFGGKIEPQETPAEAVCRELCEETSLIALAAKDLEGIGIVEVVSDHRLETVNVHATVFLLSIKEGLEIVAKEGALVKMTKDEIRTSRDQLTPATRACFDKLI
jgi:8-oxo-dGTP pyrophosphatase MutT (NUDIX family)